MTTASKAAAALWSFWGLTGKLRVVHDSTLPLVGVLHDGVQDGYRTYRVSTDVYNAWRGAPPPNTGFKVDATGTTPIRCGEEVFGDAYTGKSPGSHLDSDRALFNILYPDDQAEWP